MAGSFTKESSWGGLLQFFWDSTARATIAYKRQY